ncbi:MAG: SPOR domain-containing protein [Alphaproteobacteria bacterium]|nr:SPOR domain-containing protein [Alphaproteobacteria bacterium]
MANRDDEAPWLAEAPPLNPAPPRQRGWLNIAIAVLALGAVAAVALLMLLGRKDGGSSDGYMEPDQAPLIEADPGPWKVPPLDRAGLAVEGDGEVIHEAVRGQDPGSVIDMTAVPEQPIGRPRDLLPPETAPLPPPSPPPLAGPPANPAPAGQAVPVQIVPPAGARPAPPVVKPAPVAARPVPAVPARPVAAPARPATAAVTVQIGAFSTAAKADEEWARVAGKAGLTGKQVQQLTNSAGRTLWRVRGQAADADAACKAILAARGACEVVKR